MAELECTAGDRDGDHPLRLLFEPDCSCPQCAPEPVDGPDEPRRRWLRLSGSSQRLRIEDVALGRAGRDRLG